MKKILLLAYILLISSCSTKTAKYNNELLPWNVNENKTFENIIDSIVIIPLECNETEAYLNSYFNIKVDDVNIYISDRTSRKIISFKHDGKFNTKYGHVGKAINSGEYLESTTFCTDGSFIYFIDNFNKKLLKFDKTTGKYISNYKLPNYYYDVEVLDNGNFIFLWYPRYSEGEGNAQYKLTITDPNLNILQQIYQETEDDGYEGKFAFFSKYDDKITYHAYYQDSIQLLSSQDGSKINTFCLDIDNKIPQEFKKNKDPYSDNKEHLNYNFISSSYGSPIITNDYIFGSLYNGQKSHKHFFVYDLKNKEYIFPSQDFPLQFNGQSFSYYNGYVYFCVQKNVIDELTNSNLKVSFTKPNNEKYDSYIIKFRINFNL